MLVHEHLDLIPDEVLLCNIGQGCSDCFALLFRRYCRRVYSVALRILRDRSETEDILQEVFLAIYLQQEQFDPQKGSVRSWILQFAYFKALLRRRYLSVRHFYKREELSEVNEVRRIDPSELLGMSDAERTHYVETAVATLSNKQRRVIGLVHFEGYTLQEASQILRESLANTRNYYYRGLKDLRAFLRVRANANTVKEKEALGRKDAYGFES